jgi:hypothetical protein
MVAGMVSLRSAVTPVVPSGALRAGLAAGTAVGVASAAHGAGHGEFAVVGAVGAFVALLGPAWWLTRRERSWGAHALTQLAAQQAVHAALSVTAGGSGHLPNDLMLCAHLLAAALTGYWLRWGERRAWAAARRLLGGVLPPRPPTPRTAAPPPAVPAAANRPPALVLRHTLARRGPPVPAT